MNKDLNFDDLINGINDELKKDIDSLSTIIDKYNSFTIIANALVNANLFSGSKFTGLDNDTFPASCEYVSLECLKRPFQEFKNNYTNQYEISKDFHELKLLAESILSKSNFINISKFKGNKQNEEINEIARELSSEELMVRYPTYDHHHWDFIEELYEQYDDYYRQVLGFDIHEAIDVCTSIKELIHEGVESAIKSAQVEYKLTLSQLLKYKYHNTPTSLDISEDSLKVVKNFNREQITQNVAQIVNVNYYLSLEKYIVFKPNQIASKSGIPLNIVELILKSISNEFGMVEYMYNDPQIIHPLKDKPLASNSGKYICCSFALLDYSIENLFESTIQSDSKKGKKYREKKHDYTLTKGLNLIKSALKSEEVFTNVNYPSGEADGIILFANTILFIETKSHKITDRAKRGFSDRINIHIDDIIRSSYSQATKAYNYLRGNPNAEFTFKNGKKLTIDGTKYTNAFFITLTFEQISSISNNIKKNNNLSLFDSIAFPWIISYYDLKIISEHIESPSFLIHFLKKRAKFFEIQRVKTLSELDIFSYYLDYNLRLPKSVSNRDWILLESTIDYYNRYYFFEQGFINKPEQKKSHFSLYAIKNLVRHIEKSNLEYKIEATTLLLDFEIDSQKKIIEQINRVRKQYKKDKSIHDFSIANFNDGKSWHLTYFMGPNNNETATKLSLFTMHKFKKHKPDIYIAIYDSGVIDYNIIDIVYMSS